MTRILPAALALSVTLSLALALPAGAGGLCTGFGPQTPRDIADRAGSNPVRWTPAPPASELNLCNIHTHTSAEHKGPGFSVFVGFEEHGGYACNETAELSEADLAPVEHPHFDAVTPGDTIEVHWVYTSCDVPPGPGLGSCMSEACANPVLRVESQVFLVVNDPRALDFAAFTVDDGARQPRALPEGTGTPVQFLGSTTGTKYTETACSPLQVTWSVRPACARLDIHSLDRWAAAGNVFDEHHSHGVRHLVTARALLAPID